MLITRRLILAATTGLGFGAPIWTPAWAAGDSRFTERAIGRADAPVSVVEYFSLTCTHCAAFAQDVFPLVKDKLIDAGKIRYVFRDFPLDQVALKAAMVARSLPPDRYAPFVLALLATQTRWAFAQGGNATEELAKMAALAGMPRPVFDRAIADAALKQAILTEQGHAETRDGVDSTPTFFFSGPKQHNSKQVGDIDYKAFAQRVAAVE